MSAFPPFEVHDLPNGTTVYYRDKLPSGASDHSYWREVEQRKGEWCGRGRLTGVSTVVGPLDFRPDALMRWAARSNGAGVAMLAAEGLSLEDPDEIRAALRWLQTPESIWNALCEAQATFEDLRDEAGERGTNVHKHALHAMAEGRPVPDFRAMTEEEIGFARGVVAFFHEREPEPLQSEQVVADLDLGVAGRFDLRCVIDGEIMLIDAKTSGFLPLKAHAQLGGYEHCARVCGIGSSGAQAILQVSADGKYELIPARGSAEDFAASLDVYRRAARIGREAGADRRAREQVAA